MRLRAVDAYTETATKVLLPEIMRVGGFTCHTPGRFYRELVKYLREKRGIEMDTRTAESAINRLCAARQIAKVKGGPGYQLIVGVCAPDHTFTHRDLQHLGDHQVVFAPLPD